MPRNLALQASRRHANAPAPTFPDRDGALALELCRAARGQEGLVHIATSEARTERLARLIWALAPDIDAFLFPPWDCLPYDRTSPSARIMGLRIETLAALGAPRDRPWIVLATAEALHQRVPPRDAWNGTVRELTVGGTVGLETLSADLHAIGYREDDRVDEVGEFAVRGHVIDLFPAGYYLPVRIDHEGERVTAIASFDAGSQRRTDAFDTLTIRPVSEAILPAQVDGTGLVREPGAEHRLHEFYPELETLLDYAPRALVSLEPGVDERARAFLEQVRDAADTRSRLAREGRPVPGDRLHVGREECQGKLSGHAVLAWEEADGTEPSVPSFAGETRPGSALALFVAHERKAGRRVVLTAPPGEDPAHVYRAIAADAHRIERWDEVATSKPGSLLAFPLDLAAGFAADEDGAIVVAPADLLGARARAAASERVALGDFAGEEEFRIGDAVIHLDHGVGILNGLETVTTGDGTVTDTVRVTFAGDAVLMVPISDVELMWRYGAATDKVALDRLDGTSWPKRRAKVETEINAAAKGLAALAEERRLAEAAKLVPPRRDYDRFVARFPFSETPDQRAAVDDILRDLASGHAMDRLVCGDVGFGKTEVALRAAAAAALAGRQVAIVAPTTVLVRQHLQTFRRRFADLGIEVGHLSRLVKPADAKAAKDGLKDGSLRVVVGTHALAAKDVAFADLALLVVDEEQRFGAAHKDRLRAMGESVHVLTLSATPIPRTMQSALVGLQSVSVLATPPADRQPVRTVVAEFDDALVRDALLRERRRGGQSFVVCPHIEDIGPMAERLRGLVPELETFVAHGKLPVEEIDDTMVRFADGEGDVLLATNIIESGLDVPRANTILIWRADRFGLAQLHQLRGRVGRGRLRGAAYLLTEPGAVIGDGTRKRLATLERLDRLGAGFAISGEDLDQRGAGDLMGDTQAGHLRLIGAGLYRRLLERALLKARGLTPPEEWTPELNVGLTGRLPEDYVPEAEVRLNLYARIARRSGDEDDRELAAELADRFGALPAEVTNLLVLTRLKRLCRGADVARIDAGPQAIALTFKVRGQDDAVIRDAVSASEGALEWRDRRLVDHRAIANAGERFREVASLLRRIRPNRPDRAAGRSSERTSRARSRKGAGTVG